MNGVIAQSPSGAWTSGAAILTTVFPMLLFIVVAGALYILYTKPEVAPGHRSTTRPISYTSVPGEPTVDVSGTPAAGRSEMSVPDDGAGAAKSENVTAKSENVTAKSENVTAESENAEAKGDE